MRILVLFATVVVFLAPAGSATADPVPVRSGDHADFSRIVLEFPVRPAWSVQPTPDGVKLVTAPGGWDYELGDVFSRIGRDRIRDVRLTDDGHIELVLACDCRVVPFEVGGGALAIDVGPPRGGESARPETGPAVRVPSVANEGVWVFAEAESLPGRVRPHAGASHSAASPVDPSPSRFGPRAFPAASELDPPPLDGVAFVAGLAAPGDRARNDEEGMEDGGPGSRPSQVDGGFDPRGLAGLLGEEISRAASHGLIDADLSARPPKRRSDEDAGESRADLPDLPLGGGNVIVRTPGLDPAPGRSAASPSVLVSDCLQDSGLDLARWGDEGSDPAAEIAAARDGIVGEFDRVDQDAARLFVRRLIYYGFGAEARAALSAFDLTDEGDAVLGEIAAVLDGMSRVSTVRLSTQTGCAGRSVLWGLLAGAGGAGPLPEGAARAGLSALIELPLHLRLILGPRLGEILLAAGDPASAEMALRLITRAADDPGDGGAFLSASLSAASDNGDTRRLRELALGPSDRAADSLVTLLEMENEAGRPAEDVVLEAAIEHAFQLVRENPGPRLMSALIEARLLRREYDDAIRGLAVARASGAIPGDAAALLVSKLARDLSAEDSDPLVLRQAASLAEEGSSLLSPEVEATALALRLVGMGFPDLASRFLSDTLSSGPDVILLARLSLGRGHPAGALGTLDGIETDEAARLRAEALSMLGRHAEAAREYRSVGDRDRADRALWLSGLWAEIADEGEGPRAAVAARVSAPGIVPSDSDPIVDLVNEVASAREDVESLLAQVARP